MKQCLGIAFLLVFSFGTLTAQTPVQHPPTTDSTNPTPTLHVSAREVVLDVVVTDAKGNLVNDLKRSEFSVYEDKVQQSVKSFTPPSAHLRSASAPLVNSTADLDKIGDAPVTLLVLDELDTRFEDLAFGRISLLKYLSRQPQRLPEPATLLVVDDKSFTRLHDYTEDRDALIAAVKHHFPSYPFKANKHADSDTAERMASGLGALMQIAKATKGTPGRKNIVWVGCGFPSVSVGPADMADPATLDLLNIVKQTTKVLTDSRVTLNVIDPTIMSTSMIDTSDPDLISPEQLLSQTDESGKALFDTGVNFVTLARSTGGLAFSLRNDVDREIASAAQAGEYYYTLSYSPTNHSDDPAAFRQIHVFLSRPGLTATTRTGYFLDQPFDKSGKPTAPTTRQLAFDLVNTALSTMTFTGLHVDGIQVPKGYDMTVNTKDLSFWPHSDGKNRAEMTIMIACFGSKDRVLYHDATSFVATEPPSNASLVSFDLPLQLPAGTKRVRIVVRDAANGHLGTFDSVPK